MKIATAQIEVKIGDIDENLKKHLELINVAIDNKVDLIVFPEMSITGYCREEGEKLALDESSSEILGLKNTAIENDLTIVVGAPIKIKDKLYIGSFIFKPNGKSEIYTKQFLHTGEENYYSSSFKYNPKLKIKNETIVFAICADIDNEQHAINASKNDCSLYISSIFFSKQGIENAHKILSNYATNYAFNVLMSNFSGDIWGMKSGGKSGFWDNKGNRIAQLNIENEGLLIIEKKENNWRYKKYLKKENQLQLCS